jgi:hypothetical protein
MSNRVFAGVLTLCLLLLIPSTLAAGQSTLQTPWGHPDLQGTWSNSTTTPMERPADLEGREFLTEEERAARNPDSGFSTEIPSEIMPTGAYNDFWLEQGELSTQTSLIVDPPDGRYPPLTPEAERRRREQRGSFANGGFSSWEDFSTYDRCLTRGMPGAMSPGFYNHNYQIFQTPDHVVILVEMIHDARIIPLGGRASLSQEAEQWLGDSRGRWEGDTLVIETTNLPASDRHVIERLTRVDTDTIDYRITVIDPAEWTGTWTAAMPMSAIEGPLFEYACHEGNYAVPNMLAGSRADERVASEGW